MKRHVSTWNAFCISGNSIIFRAVACCVFSVVILCGGCSDNGIGTAVGEQKTPSIPSPPSKVLAKAMSSSSITVSWSSVSLATGYNVFCSTSTSDKYTKLEGTTSTSYTNTGLSSGTVYYYKVSAYNNGGESSLSPHTYVVTIPGTPSHISATATPFGDITVSWSSVFGATGYNVYRDTDIEGTYSNKAGTTTSLSYTNTGLSLGTTYYYKISAYNSSGEGSLSAATSPLGPPLGVSAKAISSDSITVSWFTVSQATGYNIYRDTIANGNYDNKVETTSSTSYTDAGLSSGVVYYYKVSAYNSTGEGSLSLYDSAATLPDPPFDVSVIAASSGSITLSWSSVHGATGYNVYRDISANGTFNNKVGTTSSASYTNTGLSSCVAYYYKVSAYNNSGEGTKSPSVSAATKFNSPLGVSVNVSLSNTVTVSWFSVAQATGYNVYRDINANGTFSNKVGTTSSTSYTDNEVSSCTTYYYKVSAYGSCGESSLSSPVEAKQLPNILSVFATAMSSNGIYVTWSSVCGAEGYYVSRNGIQVHATSSTSYTDTDLSPGVTYCYTVSAYNSSDGETPFPSNACATTLDNIPTTFTDSRNGKTYNTVRIGNNKVWMAENLDYKTADSWCYDDDPYECDTYGRLYSWSAAMNDACPNGWRLPSRSEWGDLARAAGGTGTYGAGGTAGTKLKSNSGWNVLIWDLNATDDYGFAAMPGGYTNYFIGDFSDAGDIGYWWTASEGNTGNAYYRSMRYDSESVDEGVKDKYIGMSVRCVRE